MAVYRPRAIAAGTAVLGAISLLTAALYFRTIPENPPGDGFAAGLTGLLVMLCVAVGALTLAEAGLLFLVTRLRDPAELPRRLLTLGAVAGSLSIVLLVVPMLGSLAFDALLPVGSVAGIGLLFVPIGVLCSGLGVAIQLVDEFRPERRA
ncbi:hypothetical protein [Haloterrigena salinisoli]|uniref:hypothetical protein n=1 Tax=Haloterrigena salinisoli TaxID=3132747 RepID=UPI0030D4C9B0